MGGLSEWIWVCPSVQVRFELWFMCVVLYLGFDFVHHVDSCICKFFIFIFIYLFIYFFQKIEEHQDQ